MTRPAAVLLDLDGTLYVGGEPIAGAREAVERLRRARIPLRVVTNSTRRSRAQLAAHLRALGFAFEPEEIFNAPAAAAAWLRANDSRSVLPLLAREAWEDLAGLTIVAPPDSRPDAVVVGDMGDELTFAALNRAFRALLGGASLVACQRNRCWQEPDGLTLDAGPFVAALEYAAGVEGVVVGKPAQPFFRMAVASLENAGAGAILAGETVLMVGDDLDSDVGGAQAADLRGVLVKTGKFRPSDFEGSNVVPDLTLDSIEQLPAALGL